MPWSVTRLSSTQWCERQAWLQQKTGKRVETVAMAAGSAIHDQLEKQIHDVVSIKTQTAEDRIAIYLLNLVQSCSELMSTGVTREAPIWCRLRLQTEAKECNTPSDEIVFGIIDEVVVLPSSPDGALTLAVRDSKTRRSGRLPSQSAQRSGKLQLQIYSFMLHNFIIACGYHVGFNARGPPAPRGAEDWPLRPGSDSGLRWLLQAWESQGLQLHQALSSEVCAALAGRGLASDARAFSVQHFIPFCEQAEQRAAGSRNTVAGTASHTQAQDVFPAGTFSLRGLLEVVALSVAQLPAAVHSTLELVYRHQHGSAEQGTNEKARAGSIIGVVQFDCNQQHMQACVRRALLVYRGLAEARPVAGPEWHKCRYCAFVHECGSKSPMVAKLGMPPADWVPEGHEGAVVLHPRPPAAAGQGSSGAAPQAAAQTTTVYDSDGDIEWTQAALHAVASAEVALAGGESDNCPLV